MNLQNALGACLLLAGANAMACYTVYDANSRIVYRGMQAPVDMSLPLHEALARRFAGGAQMVFEQDSACPAVGVAQVPRRTVGDVPENTIRMERPGRPGSSSAPAPLFTDRQTAERSHLPHTTVAGDVVVVPPLVAEQVTRPTVTVLPSSTFASAGRGAPDTSTMGAGPARPSGAYGAPDTRLLGAGPAMAPSPAPYGATPGVGPGTPKRQIIITEMRDGTVTVNDY
jgi:hypothetical protein